jgi:predicted protein tyrosine phosphatase
VKLSVSGQFHIPELSGDTQIILALSPQEYRDEVNPLLLGQKTIWMPAADTEDEDDYAAPRAHQLVAIQRTLSLSQTTPVHVACYMGVSRSPAIAAFVLAYVNPFLDDREVVDEIRRIAPGATPNRLILSLADSLLGNRCLLSAFDDVMTYG